MNSRRLSGFASAVLVAAACVATGANAASQVVTPEPDNNTVASWTAAILEAPVAMVQGVSPTNVMTSFPGSVLVPGVPESPFSDMAITQAGWLASSLGSPNPNYEIDLSNPGGRSGQWLAEGSRSSYAIHADGSAQLVPCTPSAEGYCGATDGLVFNERFDIAADQAPPTIVLHWGNYRGRFEYWAAYWYAVDVDMSYAFLVSGPAADAPPLELNPGAHTSVAVQLADDARAFVPWTP